MVVPRGTAIDSGPVEGTPCSFRTASEVALYPLRLREARLETPAKKPPYIRLRFAVPAGTTLGQMGLRDLRLHFRGEAGLGPNLYLWFCHYVRRWLVRPTAGTSSSAQLELPPANIKAAGFDEDEVLLPYPGNSFPGYRLLQEYFSLPEKFLMVDLTGLEKTGQMEFEGDFDLIFELTRSPGAPPRLSPENILLFCTAAVNLFHHEADPVRITQERFEYPVRPAGSNPDHYDVFSIDKVVGYLPGTAEEREYPSFYSFRHEVGPGERERIYYHPRISRALIGQGFETHISFMNLSQTTMTPPTEIISLELTCSNGRLPEKLRPGDLDLSATETGVPAGLKNIGRIARAAPPPLGKDVYWLLMSHWSHNYLTLGSVEAVRNLLTLYNLPAFIDRQAAREHQLRLKGILGMKAVPEERFHRGTPVRGVAVELELKEGNFTSEGEMYLFGRVLHEFMALYSTMNSFVRLTVRGVEHREEFPWPARIGQRVLI